MNKHWLISLPFILFLAAGLAGCGTSPSSTPTNKDTGARRDTGRSSTAESASTGQAAEGSVELQVIKMEPLLEKIKAQKGKIVVVDNWATWCKPCRAEFPGLVDLHRKYAKEGVVCMSVSLDKVEKKFQDEALAFLKEQHATFPNFLVEQTDEKEEEWWNHWNLKSIPAVLVFDRDGKKAKVFTGDDPDNQFTYKDVDKFVQQLLGPQ